MAKKDTYLALLRRGIDETTSMTLADAGLKIGDKLIAIDNQSITGNNVKLWEKQMLFLKSNEKKKCGN